jgi:hypothetical protein
VPYDFIVRPTTDTIRRFFHFEYRPWLTSEGTADTCCCYTMSPVQFRGYLQEALCAYSIRPSVRPSVHWYQQLNRSYDFHEDRCTNSLKTKEVDKRWFVKIGSRHSRAVLGTTAALYLAPQPHCTWHHSRTVLGTTAALCLAPQPHCARHHSRTVLGTTAALCSAPQPPEGKGLIITEASRSHSDTPQSVELLWTGDQPDAKTSTWQHTTLTTDRHPCPRLDSNPQSQQASGRRINICQYYQYCLHDLREIWYRAALYGTECELEAVRLPYCIHLLI